MGLIKDAKNISERDPAARGALSVMLLYPGFHVLVYHRIANFFFRHGLYYLARSTSQAGRFFTGIEIHPGAKIGSGLFIDHGMGVVIGETAEVGDNCTLYHGCTLGGTGKDKGKRHPTLGNNVLVGAGAKILGPFKVGDNAMIGANAVVLSEVPAGATVVGVPGHVTRIKTGEKFIHSIELDQTSTPDPVSIEICKMLHRISRIEKQLNLEAKFKSGSLSVNSTTAQLIKKICEDEGIAVTEGTEGIEENNNNGD